jgi:hypothetical protein
VAQGCGGELEERRGHVERELGAGTIGRGIPMQHSHEARSQKKEERTPAARPVVRSSHPYDRSEACAVVDQAIIM